MNKLYAFFALVFLTACGSPLDGSWVGASDDVEGVKIEISGDEAKLMLPEPEGVVQCTVTEIESKSMMICVNEGESLNIELSVDGDIMMAREESEGEYVSFIRAQ